MASSWTSGQCTRRPLPHFLAGTHGTVPAVQDQAGKYYGRRDSTPAVRCPQIKRPGGVCRVRPGVASTAMLNAFSASSPLNKKALSIPLAVWRTLRSHTASKTWQRQSAASWVVRFLPSSVSQADVAQARRSVPGRRDRDQYARKALAPARRPSLRLRSPVKRSSARFPPSSLHGHRGEHPTHHAKFKSTRSWGKCAPSARQFKTRRAS